MVAYEFYWILPERRRNSGRITRDSILNWGWKVIGDNSDAKDIYFDQVEF
jgi:hypothetical protein